MQEYCICKSKNIQPKLIVFEAELCYTMGCMSTIEFKQALSMATFDPNRAIGRHVEAVELGVFDSLSRELIDRTLNDVFRREYLYPTRVTPEGKVLVKNEPVQGEPSRTIDHFSADIYAENFFLLSKKERQTMFYGVSIHSHPVDFPPSPEDLRRLMYSDMEPDAATAVFVVTPVRRIAIFRGDQTPGLSVENAEMKVRLWERNLRERMNQFGEKDMPIQVYDALQKRAQDAQIRQITSTYKLSTFSAPLSEGILRRGLL